MFSNDSGFARLLFRGRPLIIWGGVVRISANEFFFGDPPNEIFFSATLRLFFFIFFFGKIDRRIFFNNIVLQGKRKEIFLGLNWQNIIFFSRPLCWNFFSGTLCSLLFLFFLGVPLIVFFICTTPPR